MLIYFWLSLTPYEGHMLMLVLCLATYKDNLQQSTSLLRTNLCFLQKYILYMQIYFWLSLTLYMKVTCFMLVLCLLTHKYDLQQCTCLLRTNFWLTSCFLYKYILCKYIFAVIDPIYEGHMLVLCCVSSPIKITCNKAPAC